MKFDSYSRFIKSDLYKECLVREISGEALPLQSKPDTALQLHPDTSVQHQSHSKVRTAVTISFESRYSPATTKTLNVVLNLIIKITRVPNNQVGGEDFVSTRRTLSQSSFTP